jgi:hypothetical protein
MTKDQFENLLRSTGCDENSIRFGVNAFEMGMEHEREACWQVCLDWEKDEAFVTNIAQAIRARGQE